MRAQWSALSPKENSVSLCLCVQKLFLDNTIFFQFLFPLDVEQDELVKPECLHVVVVNHVDAKVEEVLAISFGRGDERTDIQFQLVEYGLVHDAIAVDKVLEEGILLDGQQVLFRDFHASGARSVSLYGVHILLVYGLSDKCRNYLWNFLVSWLKNHILI